MWTGRRKVAVTNNSRIRVAIDGPAGSGKSTIGHGVAVALQCPYLDTGLMYRAVTLLAMRSDIDVTDEDSLAALATGQDFELVERNDTGIMVNGVVMHEDLHSSTVDRLVSAVSAHPRVRSVLVERQRKFAEHPIVMVGRDIGTVVLPDAEVKLWITASASVRAQRRQTQRGEVDKTASGAVLGELESRDLQDETRAVAPLRRAADAIVLTTDDQTPEQSVTQAMEMIRPRSC